MVNDGINVCKVVCGGVLLIIGWGVGEQSIFIHHTFIFILINIYYSHHCAQTTNKQTHRRVHQRLHPDISVSKINSLGEEVIAAIPSEGRGMREQDQVHLHPNQMTKIRRLQIMTKTVMGMRKMGHHCP